MLLHLGDLPRKNEQREEMISHSGVFRPIRFLLPPCWKFECETLKSNQAERTATPPDKHERNLPRQVFLTSKETSARAK